MYPTRAVPQETLNTLVFENVGLWEVILGEKSKVKRKKFSGARIQHPG